MVQSIHISSVKACMKRLGSGRLANGVMGKMDIMNIMPVYWGRLTEKYYRVSGK